MAILIVDDSGISRRMIREDLEAGGYKVIEASSGAEALKIVDQQRPELITLDVGMKGMDGYETSQHLRTKLTPPSQLEHSLSYVPIIFITGVDTLKGRERGFEVGGTDFLTKPFQKGELLGRVNGILKHKRVWEGVTALVVDDSEVALIAIEQALQGLGIRALRANSGERGLELAAGHKAELGLVISDFLMPRMNGDEFCQKLRKIPGMEDLPVIMLSAIGERANILRMFAAGATDYLIKPFVGEELNARVGIHLRAHFLNRELSERLTELERVNKAKDKLLAVTSHDLRSPLSTIMGYFHLASQSIADEKKQEVYQTAVYQASTHLMDMLNDLTELSRGLEVEEPLALEPVPIMEIVQAAAAGFQPAAKLKEIELAIPLENWPALTVQGEGKSLLRVMNNLLSNAIKFTPQGGRVEVQVLAAGEEKLTIRVVDTGLGIAPEDIPSLFDLYTKKSLPGTAGEQGTGLGLSIIGQLVRRNEGEISVESKLGKGSTFSLVLNRAG